MFAIPAAIFPLVTTEGNLFRYGLITLLYALLALGLNVVVGFAGLLDLGYIAFFGFGAYMYGILASGHSGRHWPAELAIPVVIFGGAARVSSWACRRDASSVTTSRSSRSSSARRSWSSSTTRTGSTSHSSATPI